MNGYSIRQPLNQYLKEILRMFFNLIAALWNSEHVFCCGIPLEDIQRENCRAL